MNAADTLPNNPRQTYLEKILGLSHDPFAGPVAEQELHTSGQKQETGSEITKQKKESRSPYFFSYYVDLLEPTTHKSILQRLREAYNGLIFAPPGSGKTTLRYTLEAECRAVYDRTLVVTYELGHKIPHPPTSDEHWANLARELAIDLFIQVIEQLDTFDVPTQEQMQHLQRQMALVWPRLRRTVKLILTDDYSNRENGLASLWPRLNRPAVRHINPSLKIKNLITKCLPNTTEISKLQSGEALLQTGIAAAKIWGFERIFVLVDGVDALEREVENMQALIAPLLDSLKKWQLKDLYFYFFLTLEMEPTLVKSYRETFNTLPFSPIWYIIKWEKSTLTELLHQRLRAAGSRVPGFNALAASELENKLEDFLVEAAHNSPRQLLRLVSALIDTHAQNEPERLLITSKDWHSMRQKWSYGPPPPPNLNINGYSP